MTQDRGESRSEAQKFTAVQKMTYYRKLMEEAVKAKQNLERAIEEISEKLNKSDKDGVEQVEAGKEADTNALLDTSNVRSGSDSPDMVIVKLPRQHHFRNRECEYHRAHLRGRSLSRDRDHSRGHSHGLVRGHSRGNSHGLHRGHSRDRSYGGDHRHSRDRSHWRDRCGSPGHDRSRSRGRSHGRDRTYSRGHSHARDREHICGRA